MLKNIKKNISIALCYFRLTVQRQLEYPLFLVSWILLVPLEMFSSVWMLKIIVNNFHSLNGWSFNELTFLYGLGLLSQGLMVIFFIQTESISDYVISGTFDRILLRPINVFFHFMVRNVNLIGVFDLISGIIIFGYGCTKVHFVFSMINIIKLLLVIISATFLRCAIFTIIGATSFWMKGNWSIMDVAGDIVDKATSYPIQIFPRSVQVFLTFIFPIAFVNFYPACDFLSKGNQFNIGLSTILWTPLVSIVLFLISQVIFNRGLKRYESSGS